MAVNGDVLHNGGEHESPVHGSAKYISPHIGNVTRGDSIDLISRKSKGGSTMDQQRKTHIAYEYLCHLEETKKWLEACIEEELPPTTELEEALRTGVLLCKLGNWYAPEVLPMKKIYDIDGSKFKMKGLHFKHTDNFNFWLMSMRHVGLPEIFYPETTDLYDKKNMPRVIYCIHALSLLLYKLGKAPEIEDLVGEATFTEEEISTMKTELDKYGINMPAFGKIGGILANELSVDEAAIHAAVLAINEVLDNNDYVETLNKLQNPMAVLKDIDESNAERYQAQLKQKKEEKGSAVAGDTVENIDAYDVLLTQSEIQDCINTVNEIVRDERARAKLEGVVNEINTAIGSKSMTTLLRALQSEDSNLNEVDPQNVRWYQDILEKTKKDHRESSEELDLTHDEIQDIILMANQIAEHTRLVEAAVLNLNCVLQSEGDVSELVAALENEYISLSAVSSPNVHYYYQGLRDALNRKRQESGNPSCLLTENEIQEVIHQCNTTADYDRKVAHTFEAINEAVVGDNCDVTMTSLQNQYADIADVDESLSERYHDALKQRRQEKGEELTKEDIAEVVAQVNEQVKLERLLTEGVAAINAGIDTVDYEALTELLNDQFVGLERVIPNNAPHYATLLAATGKKNMSKGEIQSVIDRANSQAEESLELAQSIHTINQSIAAGDSNATLSSLKAASLRSITDDCAAAYQEKLSETVEAAEGEFLEWVEHRSRDGHTYYYNKTTGEMSWVKPEGPVSSKDLSRETIQAVVTKVTADYDRWALLQSNESTIISLQSWWRGALIRRAYLERLEYLRAHEKEAVVIQAQWKGLVQRRAYKDRMAHLHTNVNVIIKIQSLVRMYRKRKEYQERLKYFQNNVAAIVRIQAFWRAKKTKKDYKQLVEVVQPPASAVRKFLSLLEQSGLDFSEEIECQRLKSQVVQQIRSNQQLEQDLNVMDIKIGLLVRNRISLQDVVSQSDQIKRNRRRKHHHTGDTEDDVSALGGMSKTNQEKIESYQHLFYLLQTNPHYFANLIFEMSPNRTNQFMENVILSVLNYAQNNREQYLLVRLFEAALVQEIDSKVFAIKDIITGNPTVIKMVIHYTRSGTGGGQSVLRDLLHPLVQDIISREDLVLNISPVDVYKAWINQMESETGEKSKLPYEVSNDDALQHDEVKTRIAQTIQVLIDATEKFQDSIMTSVNRIPYAMRYIAMRLRQALLEKFPETPPDDILKVVGNLLYYRYMNPAIVAPDAFDIIDMGVDKRVLEAEQRRNLGAIAKVLQHAAAGKLFEGENAALSSMNGYIQKAFERFKEFFQAASTVQSPAEKFGYDEYTDVIMLTKPVIYITVKELLRTHTLLVEHEEALAPSQDDPLRELLKDLGGIPTVEQLLGGVREPLPNEEKDDVLNEAAKQELALTLNNKFEVVTDDGSDMKALFVRTKRMVVDLLKVQPGDNITQVLYTPATPEQEEEHQKLIQQRQQVDKDKLNISATLTADSTFTERDLPLEGMKRKIMRQLRTLEQEDIVSSKDDYQEIINAIARDIRNQHRHRQQRKQELHRLQETLEKLNQKSQFYEEQVEYYQQYVKACLASLARAGGKGGPAGPEFKRQSIKYTAQRLHDKGVVLEIEGLPKHQFKNATIEITATEAGVFEVTGRVMGMTFEKVELVFQDLLQLQYEGVAVMKMFGRAKINVNLLIYLINKKFYGKS